MARLLPSGRRYNSGDRTIVTVVGVRIKELASQDKRASTDVQLMSPRAETPANGGGLSELLTYCGLITVVLLFFFRTVFLGLPISKICRMAEWDSIYSAFATGKSALCDPSIIHLLVPHYFLVAHIWRSGHLPLWNPYSACGAPLVGDIQATIFSPLRLIFTLSPTMYMYNLSMVLVVVAAAVFTFAFCRQLGLSRPGSILAALAYALCPYQLFYLELLSGQAYCLFPLASLLFVRAAQTRTWSSFVACGIAATLLIISGHPETSFFGIFFASLLFSLFILTGATTRYGVIENMGRRITLVSGGLLLAGIVSFCLAAPVLLPFLEYLLNSDCYKYSVDISGYVPWQGVLYHLLQPGFKQASPYLGIVTSCLWPLSLFLKGKPGLMAKCLFGMAAVAFVLMSRVGPMDFLLRHPPFLWLVTVYCVPFFLLALSAMSGFSLDALLSSEARTKFGWNRQIAIVALCLVVALAVPAMLHVFHVSLSSGDFDLILPHMSFDYTNWVRDCILGTLLIAAFCLGNRLKPGYQAVVPVVVLLLAFVGQASLARHSLPIENKFDYPLVEPIPYLQEKGERMLSVGPHLLRSNTNTVYGVSSLSDFNALFPKRYLQFAKAAGAKIEMFAQVFDSSISNLSDMASVKYILSQTPVTRAGDANESFDLVKEEPGRYNLYENRNAMPPAYVVHSYKLADSESAALKATCEKSFDYKQQVVLETAKFELPANEELVPAANHKTENVSFKRVGPNATTIGLDLVAKGILTVTDTNYPGWRAFLDGKEIPILKANYLFRAVVVPAGKHEVQFRYEPVSFWLGVRLAIGTLLVLALAAVFRGRRAGRRIVG